MSLHWQSHRIIEVAAKYFPIKCLNSMCSKPAFPLYYIKQRAQSLDNRVITNASLLNRLVGVLLRNTLQWCRAYQNGWSGQSTLIINHLTFLPATEQCTLTSAIFFYFEYANVIKAVNMFHWYFANLGLPNVFI